MVPYNSSIIKEVKDFMIARDYWEHSDSRTGQLVSSITFVHSKLHFACIVRLDVDKSNITFEFRELLTPGAFTLTSNECGSLFSHQLFEKQEYFMKYYLNLLK